MQRRGEMTRIGRNNPAGLHAPVGRYTHAVSVAPGARRVVLSGQVGMRPDGSVPEDVDEQVAQVVRNIGIVLASEGLTAADIVKVTTFLTDRAALPAWRAHRESLLGQLDPASTLLFVAGLADPRFVIEVELEAAG
jgi:2-iminobutanoate/2-iminopropanoate deaminase